MQNNTPADAQDLHFTITKIQTVKFSLSTSIVNFKLPKLRQFFVSVTDDRQITKKTKPVHIQEHSLCWDETLDGFTVSPSSQLKLEVWEEHEVRKNELFATFIITYDMLRMPQNIFVGKSVEREILITMSERYYGGTRNPFRKLCS